MAFDVAEGEGVVAGGLLVYIGRLRGNERKECSRTRGTNYVFGFEEKSSEQAAV